MVFIPGNVPSSKNGKMWTGRALVNSKSVQLYIRATDGYWYSLARRFRSELNDIKAPYKIGFQFVRGTRHQFDYVNPTQTIQDLMVRYKWIEDDNANVMIPVMLPYTYDKQNPGVYISVIKD
jgi:hypothetical protein